MGWRFVVVNEHSKLSYQNNALIFKSETAVERIQLSEIHTILIETTNVALTTALVSKLVSSKIKLIFCDEKRLPTAELMPYYGSHDCSLQLSKQIVWEENKKAEVWTEIIRQKIRNQALHLRALGLNDRAEKIETYLTELKHFDETNREGHAAKVYFNALFGKKFSREQTNDINAALDYGYSLLLSIFSREIVKNGCLTQLGLKHKNQFNAFNLASDLMEPMRPLVDRIVQKNSNFDFPKIKRQLFNLFSDTFHYKGKEQYLINIVESYVKEVIMCLNPENTLVPDFLFTWSKE